MIKRQKLGISMRMAQMYWSYSHSSAFFVFFKTLLDPFYQYLYETNPLSDGDFVVDLGSGKSLFAGWQMASKALADEGAWPLNVSTPPRIWRYEPVEANPSDSRIAAALLGNEAPTKPTNLLEAHWDQADIILLIDVMQYIPKERHQGLMTRIVQSLKPGGLLLMRVSDPSKTLRHQITRLGDWLDALIRGGLRQPLGNTRPKDDWSRLLVESGLSFTEIPMSRGTPFSNTLFLATKST